MDSADLILIDGLNNSFTLPKIIKPSFIQE